MKARIRLGKEQGGKYTTLEAELQLYFSTKAQRSFIGMLTIKCTPYVACDRTR